MQTGSSTISRPRCGCSCWQSIVPSRFIPARRAPEISGRTKENRCTRSACARSAQRRCGGQRARTPKPARRSSHPSRSSSPFVECIWCGARASLSGRNPFGGVRVTRINSPQQQPDSFQSLNGVDRRDVVLSGTALLTATALSGALLPSLANAQVPKPGVDPTPGFNNRIPGKIMTPDTVETRIGTLKFVDGVPTAGDHAEGLRQPRLPARRRGVPQLHSRGFPRSASGWATSSWVRRKSQPGCHLRSTAGFQSAVAHGQHGHRLLLSPSSTCETDGPTVVEVPPGCGPGTVDDAFFRFVIDMGAPGPDRARAASTSSSLPTTRASFRRTRRRRRVFRRALAVLRELAGPARLPGRRQAGRGVEDVPRRAQDLSAQQGGQPADDGVHQRLEGAVSTRSTPTISSSTTSSIT